jgi:hypothetical protein
MKNPKWYPRFQLLRGHEFQGRVEEIVNDMGLSDGSYTPTTVADWDSGADPGDIDDALDQLAERVDDLEAAGGGQAWPIGSVFIAVVSTDPNTLLGYGTWSAIGAGKVLVGLDSGDTDFDTVEETGGAKTVEASAQTFAGSELATHQHAAITAGTPAGTVAAIDASGTAAVKIGTGAANAAAKAHTHSAPAFTGSALGAHQHAAITAGTPAGTNTPGAATSVVQPYFVVYMWKRTA